MDVERAVRCLLHADAAVAAARDDTDPAPLFPEEAVAAARMAAPRRTEFARGRECARRALAALGVAPVALPMGADRAPRWPPGVVGSITHWDGWCAAAVAPATTCRALGLDGERRRALPKDVTPLVATASEQAWLLGTDPARHWETALFTMKEAVYKAWAPLTGTWLDFEDVDVTVDAAGGRFRARFHTEDVPPLLAAGVEGRFSVEGDAVLAAVVVPR